MKRLIAIFLLIAMAAGVSVAEAAPAKGSHLANVPARDHARQNPEAGKPHALEAGAALYKDHCAECHKANGSGDGVKKPSLRTETVRSATDGDLEWFLRQGDLAHGMPSWSSLPQSQRWQIVLYLRSLQLQK